MKTLPKVRGCFVTGTDTEVGKTRVSAGLLHWCASQGWSSAGFKPVAAGTTLIDGQWVNEDVRVLRQASSISLTDSEVGPLQFQAACAPHIAAALEGRSMECEGIVQAQRAVAERADFVVVEGVGGFCVPLGPGLDSSHVACALGLPVILVVGLRLGCLNHALLSAEAIRLRHLRLAGWIGNTIDPQMAQLAANVSTLGEELERRHQVPCLGVVPWLTDPGPTALTAHLDNAALRAVFTATSST